MGQNPTNFPYDPSAPYQKQPFNVNQDRTIDPLTVAFFCTSCPFKGVVTAPRSATANGSTNEKAWSSEVPTQANMMKIQYVCNSPNFNYKQYLNKTSSTIGFGWCPFQKQKMNLLQGNDDEGYDPS
jgi:hypothetical protein